MPMSGLVLAILVAVVGLAASAIWFVLRRRKACRFAIGWIMARETASAGKRS